MKTIAEKKELCPSFEICEKMKGLGRDKQTYFLRESGRHADGSPELVTNSGANNPNIEHLLFPAPTAEEIIQQLPNRIDGIMGKDLIIMNGADDDGVRTYSCNYVDRVELKEIQGRICESLAEASAQMRIRLKENKYI